MAMCGCFKWEDDAQAVDFRGLLSVRYICQYISDKPRCQHVPSGNHQTLDSPWWLEDLELGPLDDSNNNP